MSTVNYNHPIYIQLREVIRSKIESGEYPPGIAIPSENTLASTYGVSNLTVRSAIEALVKEGILLPVQGKGVYVIAKIERDLEVLEGFTQTMLDKKVDTKKKILRRYKREAGKKYSKIFNIQEDDLIYYIKRLNFQGDQPIAIEDIYIPYSLVDKVEGLDLTIFSLYEIYKFYGIEPVRAWQTLEITSLEQSDAKMIGLSKDDSILLFTCTTYDENDNVIEYAKTFSRGDISKYKVKFSK